jgi:chorismate-pyruvate lyase
MGSIGGVVFVRRLDRASRGFALAVALTALVRPVWAQQAAAPPATSLPDTYVSRLEALALIQTLNAEILASRSATASLENWCRDRLAVKDAKIVAEVAAGVFKAATPEQRQRLEVNAQEDVRYRRVRLHCGDYVLSEADNWYVPGRLTPEMNRLLETTTTPFGTVVRPLEPYRRTFAVTFLWAPLPDGWERGRSGDMPGSRPGTLTIPGAVFQHQAVLYDRNHRPFSEVSEVYQGQILALPRWSPR